MEAEDDIFQKLPDELLTKVTTFLLLEDAARTSILSRRWRYAWRKSPNPHFDCNKITKFTSNAYPISCFESIHHFFGWMDKIVAKQDKTMKDRTGFYIGSLGLNFNPDDEDDKYGWIEFRNSDSVVIGYRVVSFLSCKSQAPPAPATASFSSLSDVLSGRPYLLKNLTLRNCDEEILKSRVVSGGGGGDSFRGLRSLVLQCGGKSVDERFIESFIRSFPSVMTITLEDCCSLSVAGKLLVNESRIKLSVSRRRIIMVRNE
ncbi:hypothetical protein LINGRAHAP2_LOCUS33406 [Linum grandiflorum]